MDIPSGNIQKAIEHGPFIVDLYIPIKVVIFHNQLCQSTRGYIINQSVEDIYKQLYTLLIEGQLYTSINLQVKTRDRIYIYIPIKPFKQFIYTIYQSAIPPIPGFFVENSPKNQLCLGPSLYIPCLYQPGFRFHLRNGGLSHVKKWSLPWLVRTCIHKKSSKSSVHDLKYGNRW